MYILESSRNICLLCAAKKNHATYFDSSNLVLSAHKAEQRTPKNVNATRELNERTQFTWYVFPLAATETKNFMLFIVYSFQCNYKSYSCSSFWTEWTLSGIEYNCLREQSLSTFKDIICFALDRTTNWPGLPLISVHSRINIYLCGTRELGHFDHQHHVVYVICLISYNEHELNTQHLPSCSPVIEFLWHSYVCRKLCDMRAWNLATHSTASTRFSDKQTRFILASVLRCDDSEKRFNGANNFPP